MRRFLAAALAGSLLTVSAASAHEGATGIVKERMDAMKAMGALTKAISEKIKGNRNLASIAEDAAKIEETAPKIAGWFPDASLLPPSEASPAIWANKPEFEALAAQLLTQAQKLREASASGDPQPIVTQFVTMAAVCKFCHDKFRVKKE
jgi:cytochrome c556